MLAGTITKKRAHQKGNEPTRHGIMTDLQQEIELIHRIANKDEDALREIYVVYGQRLYAYALRLTRDHAQAEDVLQDALVAIWHSAKRFRGEGRLLAWLLGIVYHTAMKSLRRRSNRITDQMETSLPDTGPLPEQRVQDSERSAWIQTGLQKLSPEHRSVLELVFYQGLSLKETAQVCDCPVGTVKSRLSYARRQLRGILSRTEEIR
jgi:RNA polymerase sigma-70 factor (ECF subfamily)